MQGGAGAVGGAKVREHGARQAVLARRLGAVAQQQLLEGPHAHDLGAAHVAGGAGEGGQRQGALRGGKGCLVGTCSPLMVALCRPCSHACQGEMPS